MASISAMLVPVPSGACRNDYSLELRPKMSTFPPELQIDAERSKRMHMQIVNIGPEETQHDTGTRAIRRLGHCAEH